MKRERERERERKTYVEGGVVEHDRLLDAGAEPNLDVGADRDVRSNLGRVVNLGALVDEARLDNLWTLARLARVVGSRLGQDGRRPAAEQARVGGLVRGEDQGVGRNRGPVVVSPRTRVGFISVTHSSSAFKCVCGGVEKRGVRGSRSALDLDPRRGTPVCEQLAGVGKGREHVLFEAELLVVGGFGVVAGSGNREFTKRKMLL